ncbi:MAG: hypothetical protein ACT6QU_15555 [Aliihoeflea sp.]|uniref:hypothetical protein n=1 Tax=Aliihoeflea sp. TaxID=2608088 RepID=UPI004034E7FD
MRDREAEARMVAAHWCRALSNLSAPDGSTKPEEYRDMLDAHLYSESDPDDARWDYWRTIEGGTSDYVVESARTGDPDAHLALIDWRAKLIEEGRPIPAAARSYLGAALRGDLPKPSRGRRRQTVREALGDATIAVMLSRMVSHAGISPTRNVASETPSACSVAMEELGKVGINVSEAKLVSIWQREGRGLYEALKATEGVDATDLSEVFATNDISKVFPNG